MSYPSCHFCNRLQTSQPQAMDHGRSSGGFHLRRETSVPAGRHRKAQPHAGEAYGDPEVNMRSAQYGMAYRMQTPVPEGPRFCIALESTKFEKRHFPSHDVHGHETLGVIVNLFLSQFSGSQL
jgi:hypothetical protein